MNIGELLKEFPKTTLLIKQWLGEKMLESFKDKNVPEEFKEYMRGESIEDKNLIPIIDANPHFLFDFFDENKIYIHIEPFSDELEEKLESFGYMILSEGYNPKNMDFKNRKEAERGAIEHAFELLEKTL